MPDKKARYYQWFNTEDPRERTLGYEWWPTADTGDLTDETPGKLVYMRRDRPGDTWMPPVTVFQEIPFCEAKLTMHRIGATVEVACE